MRWAPSRWAECNIIDVAVQVVIVAEGVVKLDPKLVIRNDLIAGGGEVGKHVRRHVQVRQGVESLEVGQSLGIQGLGDLVAAIRIPNQAGADCRQARNGIYLARSHLSCAVRVVDLTVIYRSPQGVDNGIPGRGVNGLLGSEQIRKIPGKFSRVRDIVRLGESLGGAETLPIAGNVSLLSPPVVKTRDDHRSAQVNTILVLPERRLRLIVIVVKEIRGIQIVIPDKLPNIPVKLIGAGFGDHVDVGAR